MGETKVRARITGERSSEVLEAIVDTGATNTVVEESLAKQLGIRVTRTDEVEFANGSVEKVGVGSAEVEIEGIATVVPVYVYRENLIGLTTLEAAGFRLNPVTRKLERVRGKLL